MELALFKRKFVENLNKLDDRLYKINELLFTTVEEREPVEDYTEYSFQGFCSAALQDISRVEELASKIYFYLVQNGFDPCCDDPERICLTPLCEDLDKLYTSINSIDYCLSRSYNKLTGSSFDSVGFDWDELKASADTFTNGLIHYLDSQVESADYIITFIEADLKEVITEEVE